ADGGTAAGWATRAPPADRRIVSITWSSVYASSTTITLAIERRPPRKRCAGSSSSYVSACNPSASAAVGRTGLSLEQTHSYGDSARRPPCHRDNRSVRVASHGIGDAASRKPRRAGT